MYGNGRLKRLLTPAVLVLAGVAVATAMVPTIQPAAAATSIRPSSTSASVSVFHFISSTKP